MSLIRGETDALVIFAYIACIVVNAFLSQSGVSQSIETAFIDKVCGHNAKIF